MMFCFYWSLLFLNLLDMRRMCLYPFLIFHVFLFKNDVLTLQYFVLFLLARMMLSGTQIDFLPHNHVHFNFSFLLTKFSPRSKNSFPFLNSRSNSMIWLMSSKLKFLSIFSSSLAHYSKVHTWFSVVQLKIQKTGPISQEPKIEMGKEKMIE